MEQFILFMLCLTAVAGKFDEMDNQSLKDDEDTQPKYEVTEFIDEAPNTEALGPIFTNYTVFRPLNIAKQFNNTKEKNSLSFLHVKVEYDRKDADKIPHISTIKDYINGLKRGIVSGFNSIINKFRRHVNDERPNFTGPMFFINKLRDPDDNRSYNSRFLD